MKDKSSTYIAVFVIALAVSLWLRFDGWDKALLVFAPEQVAGEQAQIDSELPDAPDPAPAATRTAAGQSPENQSVTRSTTPAGSPSAEPGRAGSAPVNTPAPPALPNGRFTISGRVVDRDGASVPGIEVSATAVYLIEDGQRKRIPRGTKPLRANTGYDGKFQFENLPNGEYQLRSEATKTLSGATIRVRAGATGADLVIVGRVFVLVQGTVTTGTGESLSGVKVRAQVEGAQEVTTDDYGHYAFEIGVPESLTVVSVSASRPGFKDTVVQLQSLRTSDPRPRELNIVLPPAPNTELAKVTGTARGPFGEPISGRSVRLSTGRLKQDYRTVTDSDGQFALFGVEPASDYVLSIDASDSYQDYIQSGINVPKTNLTLDVELKKSETGTLRGRMVDLLGNAVPDMLLLLQTKPSTFYSQPVNGNKIGEFEVERVPAGELVLKSKADPYFTIEGIELQPNLDKHVSVVLDWGNYEILGRVVDADGSPIAASNIRLTWMHQADGMRFSSRRSTTADEQGNFRFTRLGPGVHDLTVSANGYHLFRLSHDVERQGSDVTVKLVKR